MKGVTRFDIYLKSQGIPIHGVSGEGASAEIHFRAEATDAQRTFAQDARATFDWSTPPPPPEYYEKRKERQSEFPIEIQVEAVYKFAKNLDKYIKDGIQPDIKAEPGTPEHWIAWQDKIRTDIPKPER